MFTTEKYGRVIQITCDCGFLKAASTNMQLLLTVMEIHKTTHKKHPTAQPKKLRKMVAA